MASEKMKAFAREYLVDLNAAQATIRAGYSPKAAKQTGNKLLALDEVQALIQAAMDKRAKRTDITADAVLQRWWDIATADPNEIIHLRRVCCRHCYGIDHQYQWINEEEYGRAVQMAEENAKEDEPIKIPSNAGGYGFNPLQRPNKQCPYCWGEGHMEIHAEDTRFLSPKAKLLYAGVKQTAAGIEIKMRDQDKAMENVARHLGMFTERIEHSGKDGGPIQTSIDLSGLTLEELRNLAKNDTSATKSDS